MPNTAVEVNLGKKKHGWEEEFMPLHVRSIAGQLWINEYVEFSPLTSEVQDKI